MKKVYIDENTRTIKVVDGNSVIAMRYNTLRIIPKSSDSSIIGGVFKKTGIPQVDSQIAELLDIYNEISAFQPRVSEEVKEKQLALHICNLSIKKLMKRKFPLHSEELAICNIWRRCLDGASIWVR